MVAKILVLHGPNLNLLGTREPEIYGHETLAEVNEMLATRAAALGVSVHCRQSNSEGELVTWIQEARLDCGAIIINAGAYSHTSLAIFDALKAVGLPVFEVHISNIHAREAYRHHSYISAVAIGVLFGFGTKGYAFALEAAADVVGS